MTDSQHKRRSGDRKPAAGTGRAVRKAQSLKSRLLTSHLRVALLSGVILALAMIGIRTVSGPIVETQQRHVPMAQSAMSLRAGLHRSSAALNGWVALRDTALRDEHRRTWEDEIGPALTRMETLSAADEIGASKDMIAGLRGDLERLENLHRWVEDVAAKPGNEPARMVLIDELLPLSAELDAALGEIAGTAPGNAAMRSVLSELRLSLLRSDRALGSFVVDAQDRDDRSYRREAERQAALLERLAGSVTTALGPAFESIRQGMATYRSLGDSVVESRRSPRANVAWNTIEERVRPLEADIGERLKTIAEREVDGVSAVVAGISASVATFNLIGFVLMVLVGGLALYLSLSAAQRLSAPIHRLSEAVDDVAEGEYREPLRADGVAEVRRLIAAFNRMQAAVRASHEELRQTAMTDELTGLPNRKSFNERIQRMAKESLRNAQHVGIIMIDLDFFKEINDSLGHAAGDRLLQAFGRRLEGSIREGDLAARLGGDEFVVVLGSLAEPQDVEQIVERIQRSVSAPVEVDGAVVTPSCTMGIATTDVHDSEVGDLVHRADLALYRAKRRQRGSYEYDRGDPAAAGTGAADSAIDELRTTIREMIRAQ